MSKAAAKETSPLLLGNQQQHLHVSLEEEEDEVDAPLEHSSLLKSKMNVTYVLAIGGGVALMVVVGVLLVVMLAHTYHHHAPTPAMSMLLTPTGPYKLLQSQVGEHFFDFYNFYNGPDSLGSAGHNTYVSETQAWETGLVNVTTSTNSTEDDGTIFNYVFIQSKPTAQGMRDSVRLEGKHRFNRGLFILDVDHVPTGCGVWPAFWLTDEDHWPLHGEIDILEGINHQTVAKTALHTSESCNMYAHVSPYDKTGYWDTATGIPNTWTGIPDMETKVEADNCWNLAPHQWFNQGCVAISDQEGSLGAPLNEKGGGVFVLEWDPANHYIKSWVFAGHDTVPENLKGAMDTAASAAKEQEQILPDPSEWGLPYAYFAIGDTTGCSADHFANMHIVLNLAFCGTVSGNRFFTDCPADTVEAFRFGADGNGNNNDDDPVKSCNAYIESIPEALDEAYWKIRGIYVFERELQMNGLRPESPQK